MSRRARAKRERISDSVGGLPSWDAISAALAADGPAASAPPRSDEELAAVTVGELTPHDQEILLVDYDPEWPTLFEREAERIRGILGARALRVEHVGSTSVPGLAAKPIIDILLVVPDSSNEPAYASDLEREGYVLRIREPDWYEHRLFKGPDTNVNVHVFSESAAEIDRMLLFRDWLREHPEERERYEGRKRELASRTWRFVQHYADAKSGVVQSILARAEAARGDVETAEPGRNG
ncbi:MAG TPA: GrpB family protein [Candidatus Limnocylindrales bacterium]|nr:GrpB family protein [Candidatus Limnocylindrales bacterium]